YGVYIDGVKISNTTLDDLNLTFKSDLIFRLSVPKDAKNVGGLTIYGKNFGNYNQDIHVRLLYN
ncbi:MAG: transcriptional regulator, partial [Halanaerobiales bacterium]